MVGHLKTCLAGPVRTSGAAHPNILLLRAQANHIPPFWLYVAVRSDARLKDLDRFLRRIWLECCGHLSEFSGPSHQKISMNTPVGEAAGLVGRLEYVYDFGSSTRAHDQFIRSSGRSDQKQGATGRTQRATELAV